MKTRIQLVKVGVIIVLFFSLQTFYSYANSIAISAKCLSKSISSHETLVENTKLSDTCHLICSGDTTIYLEPGECEWIVSYEAYTEDCGNFYFNNIFMEIPQNADSISGIYLLSGPKINDKMYIEESATVSLGLFINGIMIDSCLFQIYVKEYPNPINYIACNSYLYISTGFDCTVEITPEMILEIGPYGCYDKYNVEIFSELPDTLWGAKGDVENPVAGTGDFYVVIYDNNGNNCVCNLSVKDKIHPSIDCGAPITFMCFEEVPLVEPLFFENCSNYDLYYSDETEFYNSCSDTFKIIHRNWTISDKNYQASCIQNIFEIQPAIEDIIWPENCDGGLMHHPMLECGEEYEKDKNGNPAPTENGAGYPQDVGYEYNENYGCGRIEIFYNDDVFELNCGTKILRYWTAVDDCTGKVIEHIQVIRITDTQSPILDLPDTIYSYTKAYICESDFIIGHQLPFIDSCDSIPKWGVTSEVGTLVGDTNNDGFVNEDEEWILTHLPIGISDICFHAFDKCGNETEQCIKLNVIDTFPPIPVCKTYLTVSLPLAGNALVPAWSADNGSFDNCGDVYFKAMRLNDHLMNDGGCPELNGDDDPSTTEIETWYDDEIYFCCEDVNDEIIIEMLTFDVDPGEGPINQKRLEAGGDLFKHFSNCWSIINVQNNIKPTMKCDTLKVSCIDYADPDINLSILPQVFYNCDYQLDYEDDLTDLDNKKIVRLWTLTVNVNESPYSIQCNQTIYIHSLEQCDTCSIIFPADITLNCLDDTWIPEIPSWHGFSCDNVGFQLIREDTIYNIPDLHYKVEREWAVIDSCIYQPNTGAENNEDVFAGNILTCDHMVFDGYYRYTQEISYRKINGIKIKPKEENMCLATLDCNAYDIEIGAQVVDFCVNCDSFQWNYLITNSETNDTIQYSYNYNPKPVSGIMGDVLKDVLNDTTQAFLFIDQLGIGDYKIDWTVENNCGNSAQLNQFFNIKDKKAPTPVMLDIATAILQNGMVELNARWFDKGGCGDGCISSFDNCTPTTGLYFTFTDQLPRLWENPVPANPKDEWTEQYIKYGRYFFDATTGKISTEAKYLVGKADAWEPVSQSSSVIFTPDLYYQRKLNIYVWDKFALNENCDDNNYAYSEVLLNIGGEFDYDLSGNVYYLNSDKLFSDLEIELRPEWDNDLVYKTLAENGFYEFKPEFGQYQVSGYSDNDYYEGLSTLDILLLRKVILGSVNFNKIYQYVAADLNNNYNISTLDVVNFQKILLRIDTSYKKHSWVAIPKNFESIPASEYNIKTALNTKIEVGTISNKIIQDFYAVKMGDINNSTGNGWEPRLSSDFKFVMPEKDLVEGETYEIPVYGKNIDNALAFQFTMQMNGLSFISASSGVLDIVSENFNQLGGNLLCSDILNSESFDEDEVLFYINVKAEENVKLTDALKFNDDILRTEIYRDINDPKPYELKLEFSKTISTENPDYSFELYQNIPNPLHDNTSIGFYLPNKQDFKLTIFDFSGRELKTIVGSGAQGKNAVRFDLNKIPYPVKGVLFYKLETEGFVDIKKMIVF